MTRWHNVIGAPKGMVKTAAPLSALAAAKRSAVIESRDVLIGEAVGRAEAIKDMTPQERAERRRRHLKAVASAASRQARKAQEKVFGAPPTPDDLVTKTAEAKGHWRRLSPDAEGRDQQGNPLRGRTWVNYGLKKNVKLKPHQQDFSNQVSQDPMAGHIAAHGTGTGKTVSSIATFERLKSEGKAGRALVLAPAGLRANFAKGVDTFTHSAFAVVDDAKADVPPETNYVVASYAAFRRDPDAFLNKYKPDTIIADEFHKASNPDSATWKSLMYAREKVPNFMGLTASIVQNKSEEVVPLVQVASGGRAPIKTKKEFRKRHVKKVPTGQKGVFGGKVQEERLDRKEELFNRIGGHIHYIEDLDATEKPPKEIRDVGVAMSREQKKLYSLAMQGVDPSTRRKISLGQMLSKKETMDVFARLMKARQISNSLHTLDPDMPLAEAAEKTPKIRRILDDTSKHLRSTPDGKIVIYTNMVKGGVDVISAGLSARGIPYGVFAGKSMKGMTEKARQQAVEDYKAGDKRVIIITGAGAEGLNLPNTTMVMLADGHYNPERMNQAMARGVRAGGQAHRPLEKRKVEIRRYVSTVPKNFWQTITLKPAEKSVGQWVYLTADRKARSTGEMRDIVRRRHEHEKRQRDSTLYRVFGGGP